METLLLYADITPLLNEENYANAYRLVSKDRQERADRKKFMQNKAEEVAAELLLIEGLRQIGREPEEISYTFGKNGKPYLKGMPDVYFNYSHAGGFVLCAIADCEVGCDIEKIDVCKEDISKRFFHPLEIKAIEEADDKQKAFTEIWTAKESYLKAIGTGLQTQLNSFSCVFLKGDTARVNGWMVKRMQAMEGVAVSICIKEREQWQVYLKKHVIPDKF